MDTFAHVYDILAELARPMDSYLGIGVQEGNCVAGVVRANPNVNLVLCDTWGPHSGGTNRGNHNHIVEMLKAVGHRGMCEFLDGDSKTLVPLLQTPVDLSFVDGSHGEEDAFTDLVNAWHLTKYVMVVHDMTTLSVMTAFARFITTIKGGSCATFHVAEGPGQGTVVLYRGKSEADRG